MTQAAAFQARFVLLKPIPSRSVLQIICEVPIEHESEVLAVTGGTMPKPGKDIWLAHARLEPNLIDDCGRESPSAVREAGGKRATAEPASRLAYRAGIACKDPRFWAFLTERGYPADSDESAVAWVYKICEITSRKQLFPQTPEGNRWDLLESAYIAWREVPGAAK